LEALAGWVDRRTGVISDLFIEPPDDPVSVFQSSPSAPPHVMEKDGSLHRLPAGWGKGLTISGRCYRLSVKRSRDIQLPLLIRKDCLETSDELEATF
jgi:hypothetical protein